jgi:hypothetical protein
MLSDGAASAAAAADLGYYLKIKLGYLVVEVDLCVLYLFSQVFEISRIGQVQIVVQLSLIAGSRVM